MSVPAGGPCSAVALAGRIAACTALALLAGCNDVSDNGLGDPYVGKIVIAQQTCGSCHRIPGIDGAEGTAASSLAHFATRPNIAGALPNTPAEMVRFLQAPETMVKGGGMPNMALTPTQARQIAAYLYTLK